MSYARRLRAERLLLNLPVRNCKPTRRCAAACYACEGPIAWKNSIRKALAVDAALRKGEIEGLVWECRMLQGVRLCGSGDLTLDHVPAVIGLAEASPGHDILGLRAEARGGGSRDRHS